MTRLSVNINKVATLRNARGENVPDVVKFAEDCESLGAEGITVHPRPDERHITRKDVADLCGSSYESLDTPQICVSVPTVGHRRSEFVKADSLHHTERVKHKGHQLYSCQIHCLSKMLLHNREDLVNFDQVLGCSNFHGEKLSNFSFKLLILRDFCKFKHLLFRCLTTYYLNFVMY